MKLKFLIFLRIFSYAVSFEFADPHQPGVTFGDKISSGAQQITVDEKNADDDGTVERIKIVLITGVEGAITVAGNLYPNQFDVTIIDGGDDSQKYVEVNRVDYEMYRLQATVFPIDIISNDDISTKQTIALNIKNLDDESPTLIPNDNCIMDENTRYIIDDVSNNPCSFIIQDPDGFLSGMDFTGIIGEKGENDLFEFRYKEIPSDDVYESEIYLVLKNQPLDFEQRILYVFHIEAKDAEGHSTSPVSSVRIIVQVNDQPDEDPVWDNYFKSTITTDGKNEMTLNVSAIDGDYGINNEINYSIEEIEGKGFVSIDSKTGVITIAKIDNSYERIVFNVTAFEVPDPNANITKTVTVFVEGSSNAATLQRCFHFLIISFTTLLLLK